MNEQKKGIWAIMWGIVAPIATELGHDGIDWLVGKLNSHKAKIAPPVATSESDPPTCPKGQHWDATLGQCVSDVG